MGGGRKEEGKKGKGKGKQEERQGDTERIWKVVGAVIYGEGAGPLRPNGHGRVCFAQCRFTRAGAGVAPMGAAAGGVGAG